MKGWFSSWLQVELDASQQWKRRAVRALRGRRSVRLEVVVPKLEVELVRLALDRQGWRFVSSVAVGKPGGSPEETADEPTLVLFSSSVRANATPGAVVRLGYRADAALRDAGVRGLESVAIDASMASDRVERWTPAVRHREPTESSEASTASGADPGAAVHILGSQEAARTAWTRIQRRDGWSEAAIERQPTAGQRLAGARRAWKKGDFSIEPAGAIVGLFVLVFVGSTVWSQFVAHSRVRGRAPSVLWAHVPLLRWTLVVAAAVFAVTALTTWTQKQRLAFARHRPTDEGGVEAYRDASRQSILELAGESPGPYRWLVGLTSASLGVTLGIGIGASSLTPEIDMPGVLAAFLLYGVVQCLWITVRHLRRRRPLVGGLTVATAVAAVVAIGQYSWYLYYAGMGRSADEVDIAPVDALIVGSWALCVPILFVVLAVGSAVVIDRHSRLSAIAVLVIFLVGAVAQLNANLVGAQRTGRRVAMGLPTRAGSGLRLVPHPKAKCVAWVDPDARFESGPLPRFVWEIGSSHDQLLLLLPEDGRARRPLEAGDDQATYSPARDLQAPSQPVGRDQVRFTPLTARGTC